MIDKINQFGAAQYQIFINIKLSNINKAAVQTHHKTASDKKTNPIRVGFKVCILVMVCYIVIVERAVVVKS